MPGRNNLNSYDGERATRDDVNINPVSVKTLQQSHELLISPVYTDGSSSSLYVKPNQQKEVKFDSPVSTDECSSSSNTNDLLNSTHTTRVNGRNEISDSYSFSPAKVDECSSSPSIGKIEFGVGQITNHGQSMYCPSGSNDISLMDRKSLLEGILSYCKPLNVENEVINRIRHMIANRWPQVSEEALLAIPRFAQLYKTVKSYNLPNCLGAKVPIDSGLNVERWVVLLQDYHDNELCHYLAYGWPIGFYSDAMPQTVLKNHPSALQFPDHINEFISTELKFQAIEGPVTAPPFHPWYRISPLMTRPKKGTLQRRVIVDLSYPDGLAVNTGINTAEYLGRDISYTLPTISDLIAKLQIEGQGAYIWKADLARAYRQLRADPVDAPLLCIQFNDKVYIDRCPPFGCRSSSAACQRVANALVFLMAKKEHHCLAYLDDFSGCSSQIENANQAFKCFKELAEHLGLQLSTHKCFQPATRVEWLGYLIDTNKMTVSIPPDKLKEVVQECGTWLKRKRVTKTMVQSLVGKLSHVANCVLPGRKFLARMLGTLRAFDDKKWTTIDQEFIKDVNWFYNYATSANGITLYSPQLPTIDIECDASLEGAGGNNDTHYYAWKYTAEYKHRFPTIHQLEAINTLVAYRTLAHINNRGPISVCIYTDNMSSSQALMSGRTKDTVLAACAREFWLEAAKNGDRIEIEHRPGTAIPLADALSRMTIDNSKLAYVRTVVAQKKLCVLNPVLNNYVFFNPDI